MKECDGKYRMYGSPHINSSAVGVLTKRRLSTLLFKGGVAMVTVPKVTELLLVVSGFSPLLCLLRCTCCCCMAFTCSKPIISHSPLDDDSSLQLPLSAVDDHCLGTTPTSLQTQPDTAKVGSRHMYHNGKIFTDGSMHNNLMKSAHKASTTV